MQVAPQPTLYELLESLPEGLTGEILDGQIHTMPRPSGPHGRASAMLNDGIFGPYDRGRGGPGGWWIFVEPEVHLMRDREVVVPDLAGWKREHMPSPPQDQRFEVVPDWVCEILSPSTESKDRKIKMPLYARYGVPFAWLVDPIACTLEVYALEAGDWQEIGRFSEAEQAAVVPFEAVTLISVGCGCRNGGARGPERQPCGRAQPARVPFPFRTAVAPTSRGYLHYRPARPAAYPRRD